MASGDETALFDEYAAELDSRLRALEAKPSSVASKELEVAGDLLRSCLDETRTAPPAVRARLRERTNGLQRRLDSLRLGLGGSAPPSGPHSSRVEAAAMAAETRSKHIDAVNALHSIEGRLDECVAMGAATMSELKRNHETLDRIKGNAETMTALAGEAHSTTRRMETRSKLWFLPF